MLVTNYAPKIGKESMAGLKHWGRATALGFGVTAGGKY
jgi:hypothetical protein